ncbi:MAG TPA: hypothetical protein VFZ00_22685 [Solirubrobacter sp.]|nr:hypothetical protein [Solirubrobacter sp.]
MARDLIPPPSPAGRPQPEGTPRLVELPPDPPPAPEARPEPTGPLPPSRFRNRFGFLMGALGGVVIAAALVFAVVLSTSGTDEAGEGLAPNWSKWRPSDTSIEGGAAQIAKKVGAEYRHPDGRQLVDVTGGPLPLEVIVRPASGNIEKVEGDTVIYNLNGLGPRGSIKGGKPSVERLKVLQREALELALYTFRYLPDVDGVVTLLPPPPPESDAAAAAAATPDPSATRNAIFYRPGDLKPQLQVPLGATLSAKAPTPDNLNASEASAIDTLTMSNRFEASVPTPPGVQLVLDRITG